MRYFFLAASVLLIVYLGAPTFLLYRDRPVKSDAVLLMVGFDNQSKEKRAEELIRNGYADTLIIPAWMQVYEFRGGALVKRKALTDLQPQKAPGQWKKWLVKCPENTHIELLRGFVLMDRLGLESAIVLSSPYHMRRIKIIATYLNTRGMKLIFVPSVPLP